MNDFGAALGNFAPSLTLQDLDKYDKLQEQYAPEKDKKGQGGAPSMLISRV